MQHLKCFKTIRIKKSSSLVIYQLLSKCQSADIFGQSIKWIIYFYSLDVFTLFLVQGLVLKIMSAISIFFFLNIFYKKH